MKKKENEELFIPKTKHKALKITLAILLIIGLGIGGYFLYQEKFNNPKKIVTGIIEDMQKETKNSFNIIQNDDKYKVNGLVKINTTLPGELKKISEIIKNLNLQFGGEFDNKNNINKVTLNTKYKDEKLIDIKIYNENKDVYFFLDGLYDKYLHASMDDELKSITTTGLDISPKDTQVLFNCSLEAFKKAIDELEIKRNSTSIIINEKEYKVNNNYIELKGTEFKNFLKQTMTNLFNDDEFKTVFKKLTHEDAQSTFDIIIKNIDKQDFKEVIKFNFYTKGILTQKLVSIRIDITNEDEKKILYIDQINDDEAIITFKTTGVNILGKIKKTNSIANLNLNVEIMGMSFTIEVNTNYEKINEVTKEDVSNSKDIEKLTEEESQAIENKIQDNKALANLLKDIAETNLIQE